MEERGFAKAETPDRYRSPRPFFAVYCRWMKTFLVAAMVAVLAGCATSPENRIDATIKNDTPMPLVIKVSTPLGSTTVVIPPGATWSGSVDRRLIFSPVKLVVELPTATK